MSAFTQNRKWSHAALLLSALLLMGCGKYVEEEKEIGLKGIAKFNHFLAASRLMEELGVESESYPRLPSFPPPPNTTLFLPVTSISGDGMFSELDDWIYEEGGTLVAYLQRGEQEQLDVFSYDDEAGEEFFEYFEVEYEEVEVDYEDSDDDYEAIPTDPEEKREYFREQLRRELKEEKEEEEEYDATRIMSIDFDSEGFLTETYETDFRSAYTIHFTGDEEEDRGNISIDYEYGEGRVMIWSTAAPFTNEGLQKKEHALMLWDLVQNVGSEEVWFVHSSELSFWKLLWEYGAYAIITLGILLFLWIWASTRRFGPIFQTVDNVKNTLSEHLHVSGSFFTKHGADAIIIEEMKRALFLKLARKTNQPINSAPETILTACEKQSVLPKEQLSLLRSPLPEKRKDHLTYLSKIQQLYKTL